MESNHGFMRPEDTLKRPSEDMVEGPPGNKRPKIVFQTRCNPKLNFRLMHSLRGFPQFRKLLCDLGLDCLLNLRLSRLQRELCAELAKKVDVRKKVLTVHGTEIDLTYASVTKIVGLPCSGLYEELLVQIPRDEQLQLCTKLKLDASAMISQNSLWSHLDGSRSFDEEFKAKLLLFIIGTMIRPTTNVHVHFRDYIPMLHNIESMCDFNWAKFLLDGLLDSVNSYQLRGAKSLGGCVLYLQLIYLHCISPLPWTRFDDCMLATPTLKSWTDERVTAILRILREQGGLHNNTVSVQTCGILPTNGDVDNNVLPQLLMHDVLITRLKRRLDDSEFGLPQLFQHFSHYVSHLTRRIRRLEESNLTNTADAIHK